MVSVPCVMTTPSTSGSRRDRGDRRPHRVPVGGRQLRTVHRHQVDDLGVEPGNQVCAAGRRPLDAVIIGAAGDRPAGGDHDEAAHTPIIAKSRLGNDGGVTDESAREAEPKPRRRIRLLVTVAAVILLLDIVTKVLAVKLLTPGQPVSIIGDTVTWTLVRNSGAAFSMATGYTWVLTLIASGVVVGIIWMGRRLVSPWWAIGLGMILGGAMGNLVDRFFRSPGRCGGTSSTSCPSAGGRCSTSPIRRWWAGRSSWLCCRCSGSTSTPWAGVGRATNRNDGRPA